MRVRVVGTIVGATCLFLSVLAMPGPAAAPVRAGGISGTIVSKTGTPLTGAKVTAYALPGLQAGCAETRDEWRPVASTSTRTGAFELKVRPGIYRIGAVPADLTADSFGYWIETADYGQDLPNVTSWVGYANDVSVPANGRSGLVIHLATPASITGGVFDHTTSLGIANVEVRAALQEYQLTHNVPSARTASDGRYAILGIPAGAPDPNPATAENEALRFGMVFIDPAAWHELWLWWWSGFPQDPTGNNVRLVVVTEATAYAQPDVNLMPSGRINGKVLDQRGRPVGGIEVEPTSAFPYVPVTTDGKGRFALPTGPDPGPGNGPGSLRFRDPNGRYRTAYYPGFEYMAQGSNLYAQVGHEVSLTQTMLGDAARVDGAAWFTAGMPAAGVWVQGHKPGTTDELWLAGNSVLTSCDGTFALTGLWPGAHTLDLSSSIEGIGVMKALNVNNTAGATSNLGTVALPSRIISGRVNEDGTGSPIGGIQVDLYWTPGGELAAWADAGATSARMMTTMDTPGEEPGTFRVWVPAGIWNQNFLVRFSDPKNRYLTEWFNDVVSSDPGTITSNAWYVSDPDPNDDQGRPVVVSPPGGDPMTWGELHVALAPAGP